MKFQIRRFTKLKSTNTTALKEASRGAPEGLVVLADYQTNGRGQFDRKWLSPRGKNLLFSVLLRPAILPNRAPLLTQIAAHAVAKVLKHQFHLPVTLKHPNDILVKNKKICGILVESSSSTKRTLDCAVIGIGLNVNAQADELLPEATSIKTEQKGRSTSRSALLRQILNQLDADLQAL